MSSEPLSAARAPRALALRGPAVSGRLLGILALGLSIESVLILGLVRPLWLFGDTAVILQPEPLAARLGHNLGSVAWFAGVLVLWLAGYAAALRLSRGGLGAGERRALLVFPVLFAGTLLLVLPVSSKDVYHYVMEGRVLAVYGDNSMNVPPAAYPADRLGWVVSSWQETPSRYGPAFNLLAGAVAIAGHGDLVATVLGFKLLAAAALLGTAWLSARTAGIEDEGLALPAYVFVAWNPLALYEAGANAHNDLLMVLCAALALHLAARGRLDLALAALALGALVKYVVVLLAPVMLMAGNGRPKAPGVPGRATGDEWGRGGKRPDTPAGGPQARAWRAWRERPAVRGVVLSAALGVAMYAPFWNGVHTFDALRGASGEMLNSPGWLLRQGLKHRFGWEGSRPIVVVLLSAGFLAGYGFTLLAAWRRRRRTPAASPSLLPAPDMLCLVLALWLCTVSWWVWPWYAVWLLPCAAIAARGPARTLTAFACAVALLAYIPINFREVFWGDVPTDDMPNVVGATMFGLPALAAVAMALRGRLGLGAR